MVNVDAGERVCASVVSVCVCCVHFNTLYVWYL